MHDYNPSAGEARRGELLELADNLPTQTGKLQIQWETLSLKHCREQLRKAGHIDSTWTYVYVNIDMHAHSDMEIQ